MSHELIYTSAERGLKPGSTGFCTVASTPDLPERLARDLENLSGYPGGEGGPIAWSHLKLRVAIRDVSVLSRKVFAKDYNGRNAMFAHHMVLDAEECPEAGPAWALRQPLLQTTWDGHVGLIAAGRKPRPGDREGGRCTAWEQVNLDPGWAGALAEAFEGRPTEPTYVIYSPGLDLLSLLEDAIALLKPSQRWAVTFSTYAVGLPPNLTCHWRGLLDGSREARDAQQKGGLVVNLAAPVAAPDGDLAHFARTGVRRARAPRPRQAPPTGPSPSAARAARTDAFDMVEDPIAPVVDRPGQRPRPRPKKSERGWFLGAGLAAAFLFLGLGFLAWNSGSAPNEADEAVREARRAGAANRLKPPEVVVKEVEKPGVTLPLVVEKKPETPGLPAPEPTETPEPPPPRPTGPAVVRSVRVDLPVATARAGLHDGNPRVLLPELPSAKQYLLKLHGLDDPEVKDLKLVSHLASVPSDSGPRDMLVVAQDEGKGGIKAKAGVEPVPLARFWVEEGQLKFRWAPEQKLFASQVAASQVLRDCILEVEAGQAKVNLALRSLLNEPKGITLVDEMPRKINWGKVKDQPGREVTIRSCQVKHKGKWLDLPAMQDHPNDRRLTIASVPGGDSRLRTLTLRVRLLEHAADVRYDTEPPYEAVKSHETNAKKLVSNAAGQVKTLRAEIQNQVARCEGILGEMARINNQDDTRRLRALALEQAQKYTQQGMLAPLAVELVPQLIPIEKALAEWRAEHGEAIKRLAELRSRLSIAEQEFNTCKTELAARTSLKETAEKYQGAPIRMKLAITIDGQEFEVATIGDWSD